MRKATAGTILAVILAFAASQAVAQAQQLTEAGTKNKIEQLLPKAQSGDHDAEEELADQYYWFNYFGHPEAIPESIKWRVKAADAGVFLAQRNLGLHNYKTIEAQTQAMDEVKKAADQGSVAAQAAIANFIADESTHQPLFDQVCDIHRKECSAQFNQAIRSFKQLASSGQLAASYKAAVDQMAAYQARQDGRVRNEWLMLIGIPIGGIAFLVVVVIFVRKSSRKWTEARLKAEAAAAELAANPVVVASSQRWPEDRFPRIAEPLTDQQNLNMWALLLDRWPSPPATDRARQENERQFWGIWASRFTELVDGEPQLAPKQEIIDQFSSIEKWCLREYYGATGIYHEPHLGPEYLRLFKKYDEAVTTARRFEKVTPEMTVRWSQKTQAEHDFRASRDKYEDYMLNGKKAHTEKWGGWFFMNIEQAFREANAGVVDEDVASQKVHGDARLATEAEALAAAADGGNRRSSVHDREF